MKMSQVFRKVQLVEEPKKEKKPPLAVGLNSKFVYSKGSDVMKTFKRYSEELELDEDRFDNSEED